MPDNSASEGSSTLGAQHQKDNQLMPVRVEAWPITRMNSLITPGFGRKFFDGEFDPGSGRTLGGVLNACKSNETFPLGNQRETSSGERVSNT